MFTKKENWSLISTDINIMLYEDFLANDLRKNRTKQSDKYLFI